MQWYSQQRICWVSISGPTGDTKMHTPKNRNSPATLLGPFAVGLQSWANAMWVADGWSNWSSPLLFGFCTKPPSYTWCTKKRKHLHPSPTWGITANPFWIRSMTPAWPACLEALEWSESRNFLSCCADTSKTWSCLFMWSASSGPKFWGKREKNKRTVWYLIGHVWASLKLR